jgi:hypothetical protein
MQTENFELDPRYRWYRINLKDENKGRCYYYFRGATAKELRVAGSKIDVFDSETYILDKVVYPKRDWNKMLGGVAMRLLQEIYRFSGLNDEQLTFQEAINWIQSENGAMEAAAVAMVPSCTPDVLENCDPFVYAKFLMMGKFQFESMYGIPVEQAFLSSNKNPNSSNGIDTMPNPGPAATPGPGEIGRQVENQFVWRKQ